MDSSVGEADMAPEPERKSQTATAPITVTVYASSSIMVEAEPPISPPVPSPPLCPPPSPRRESQSPQPLPPSLLTVSAAYKSYGKRSVLDNLSIDVRQGSIYALLGASGCGKTTLLSCIVGTKRLDSGRITFAGQEIHSYASGLRSSVGYMPQELALYREFTIREALLYFGRIYGMPRGTILERGRFLVQLLQLPDWGTEIRALSGGQQRRTSLACALVHSPRLLILDEPTVGVDPLLRKAIWAYLTRIVAEPSGVDGSPTTVIITTHYIEEAGAADAVGLMRSGRILAEGPPADLMGRYGTGSLEDLFLVLSQADEEGGLPRMTPLPTSAAGLKLNHKQVQRLPPRILPYPGYFSRLGALVAKNFIYIWRQILFIFFLLMFPALQIFLCCWAIGTEPWGLPFGVVNHETGQCAGWSWSCEFVRILGKSETFSGALSGYSTEAEAVAAMTGQGAIYGYVVLSKDFSGRLEAQAELRIRPRRPKDGGQNKTGYASEAPLTVQLDQTSRHITISVQKALGEAYRELLNAVRNRSGPAQAAEAPSSRNGPIHYAPPIYGHSGPTLVVEYVGPGLVLAVIFFAAISITGLSYVVEKREGMLERSIVAGVSPAEIITAHLLSQCLIVVVQAAICLAVLFGVFRVPVHVGEGGSQAVLLTSVVALTVLQGFLGMFAGFVLSAVCDEEKVVMQWALAITLPMVVVAGVFWPTAGMPEVLQWLGRVLVPQTHATEAIRSMLSRGWGISHPKVWPGFAVTVGYSLGLWVLANLFAARGVAPKGAGR